jgi:hypothetical protein
MCSSPAASGLQACTEREGILHRTQSEKRVAVKKTFAFIESRPGSRFLLKAGPEESMFFQDKKFKNYVFSKKAKT